MECKTFSHIDENGEKVFKSKKTYDTHDEAIAKCKKLNLADKQINKLVSYKCKECCKYHIGRNGKPITDKYRNRIIKNKPKPTFKIIGKIDLK